MDEIPLDPVVLYYLKISTAKENVGFSEICLRLALTQLLGRTHVFTNAEIKMYEKVFLLYYTRKGFTEDKIVSIMATCFDAATVREHLTLPNRQLIINEWRQFQKEHLIDVVYRNAAIEMLKEWRHRCMRQQNDSKLELKLHDVQSQVEKVCAFLIWDTKHRQKFVSRMWLFLNDETTAKSCHNWKLGAKPASLDCVSIFESVKPQLSPWLVSMVERRVRQCVNPIRTTLPLQQVVQLKRLPEGTTIKLETSRKKFKNSHHSKKRIIVEVEEPTNFEPKPEVECQDAASTPALQTEEPIDTDCGTTKYENVIDFETAMSYIDQLKTYALAKECFEALDPLEQIETCFDSGVNG